MTRSGPGSKELPICNFFAELSFLRDIVTYRKTVSNISLIDEAENHDSSRQIAVADPEEVLTFAQDCRSKERYVL